MSRPTKLWEAGGKYTPFSNIAPDKDTRPYQKLSRRRLAIWLMAASIMAYLPTGLYFSQRLSRNGFTQTVSPEILARCRALDEKPGPPNDFYERTESDRFVSDTNPVLILNATIWTGNQNGTEVLPGDLLLDRGIIKWIGRNFPKKYESTDLEIIDAEGSWVTPG